MANLLLQPLVDMVMQKATNSLVQQVVDMWGVEDQRQKLHDLLLAVHAVLADAEDKGASNSAVTNWMLKLKAAAYDAEDVLDEFRFEELRQDAVKRGHNIGNNVSGFFSLHNPALFRYKMSRKLRKVVGRIEELVDEMEKFRFVQGQRVEVANRVRTDSVLVESKVVGRDEDKEIIVKLLLEECESADLTVVPVVGMGGLGKTTLAQLIYNDPRVKEHFKLPLWVCVSEEFNIGLVVKSIIELVKGDYNVPIVNMELLQRRLYEAIGGKRYFLVLDDVWNENVNDWERLRALLNCGESGSAIIVTTRSRRVGSIMGTIPNYNLGCLGEEDSWGLFHKKAFSMGVKECQELIEIGRKMVRNCRGLPLAINTLGSLMSYRHEIREWLTILQECKIWEQSANDEVLPVLRLSYDQLPSYMKQCFAFCAVFPKDYEMNKEKLIQFWIANGFIPSDGSGSPEMKGNDIFNELVWRSFLHEVRQVDPSKALKLNEGRNGSDIICKMHDLMHDLAQSIMGGECCFTLEVPAQLKQPIISVRHIYERTAPLDINTTMHCFPSVRSLMFSSFKRGGYVKNIGFLKSNSLRILELHVNPIQETMITPEKMKHLRYLELSYYDIKLLPEMISILYLLHTLKLPHCRKLRKLPEGMRYMSSLRHLYIEGCYDLRCMPESLGQLSNLQILTTYIVGTDDHNSIRELNMLNNLHGQLHLYNLRNIKHVVDAREANLMAKQNLDGLALCWAEPNYYRSFSCYDIPASYFLEEMHCDPFEVLDALKPCNKLKVLEVTLYRGDKFPIWMIEYQMLENLIELYITECRECTKIPPVEKLPFLQILELKHLDKLTHLCNIASVSVKGGEDAQIVFPSLEQLHLHEMPNLCSWCKGEAGNETSLVFPILNNLNIIDCPKLIAMPMVPLLKKLFVKGNKTLSGFATRLTALQELSLASHCREVRSESESISFQPWESLEELSLTGYNIVPLGANEGEEVNVTAEKCTVMYLESCNFILSHSASNKCLWFWKCFTFLQYLFIGECDSLIYWPEEEFRCLNCLREIVVSCCPNFLGSQLESSVQRSITELLLPKLQCIVISECPNLIKIPRCSASLEELCIHKCSKLQCISEWLASMVALKELQISECESLNSLPFGIGGLMSLEKLEISYCHNLSTLPEGMEGLKALRELKIGNCPEMRVLPEGLLQQLKNLNELCIEGCPHLERHFRKNRKYQHLISEIYYTEIGDSRKFGILSDLTLSISPCKSFCISTQS